MKKLLLAASLLVGLAFFGFSSHAQESDASFCEQANVESEDAMAMMMAQFPQACSGPNDCHVFQTCVGGICVDRGSGDNRCIIDSDCGIGGRCVVGQCQ